MHFVKLNVVSVLLPVVLISAGNCMQEICCGGMFLEFCTNVVTGSISQIYCLPCDKVPTVIVLLRCSDC